MEDGDLAAEAVGEAADDLRGEGDLGDEDDRRARSMAEAPGDGAEVDLGLAAAGDAVEQGRGRVAGGERPLDRRPGGGLGGGQGGDGGARGAVPAGVAEPGQRDLVDDPFAGEGGDDPVVGAGAGQDVREGDQPLPGGGSEPGALPQKIDDRPLSGGTLDGAGDRLAVGGGEADEALDAGVGGVVGDSDDPLVRNEGVVIRYNMGWTLVILAYLVGIGLLFYFVLPGAVSL